MAYKRNCKSCMKIRGNPKLRARVYHAYFEREPGDETLQQIADDEGLTQPALLNHCKKHMLKRSPHVLEAQQIKRIETIKAKVAKDTELAIDHDEVVPKQDFEQAVDAVIADGLEELRKGTKTVSISQLLAAAKIKADYVSKKRGQDAELIKTMYRAAGGGQVVRETETEQAARELGVVDTGRPERPGDIHHEAPWDAVARRADTVPEVR